MPPGPRLIPVNQWLERTSLTGRFRSAQLKALDDALAAYQALPSERQMAEVRLRFMDWKASEGGGEVWRSSPRNRGPGVGAFTELEALLFMGGDSDQGIGIRGFEAINHRRARLGVLYLFSKMTVSTNVFGMILDTVNEVGMGAFNFGLSGTAQLDAKVASVPQIPDVGGNLGREVTHEVFGGSEKYLKKIPQYGAKAGQKALGSAEKIVTKNITEGASGLVLGVKDPKLEWTRDSSGHLVLAEVDRTLWGWFKDFVERQIRALSSKFKSLKGWAPVINLAIKAIISEIWKAGGSLLSDAVKTVAGIEQTLRSFGNRLASAVALHNVRLVDGYPSAVVDALHRSMMLSGAEGLYMIGRGAGGMALTAFAGFASAIVSMLLNACEKIFRLLWRLCEISEMRECFADASREFPSGKAYEDAMDARKAPAHAPFHAQPIAFSRWFRDFAVRVPVLACLTLSSGICGDKMTYLSMYNENDSIITSQKFLSGAAALDNLKVWGDSYLASSGYEFHSSDPFVSKLLTARARNAAALAEMNKGFLRKRYDDAMTVLG